MEQSLFAKYNLIFEKYRRAFPDKFISLDDIKGDYVDSIIKIIEFWALPNPFEIIRDLPETELVIKEESYDGNKIRGRLLTDVREKFPLPLAGSVFHFHSTDFHGDLNAFLYFLLKSGIVNFVEGENHLVFYDIKGNRILNITELLLIRDTDLMYCFPIPNIKINPAFNGIVSLGGDLIDRGKFSIPTILTLLHLMKMNQELPTPKSILSCLGNHEYDLIKKIDKLDNISKSIALMLIEAVKSDLVGFVYNVFGDLVVSHSVVAVDIPKILNILDKQDIILFFPDFSKSDLSIEKLLSMEMGRNVCALLNHGVKKIVTNKTDIQLCDVCVYDIPIEGQWLTEFGLDKLKFRNIIGHQIDNRENSFRIPIDFDGIDCFEKFLITDACQCVFERENVARNPDITPARFLHNTLENQYRCAGANISNQKVLQIGLEYIKQQKIIDPTKLLRLQEQ